MRDISEHTKGWRRIGRGPTFADAVDLEPPDVAGESLWAPVYFEGIRSKRILAYLIDLCLVLALSGAWWIIGSVLSVFTLFAFWPLVAVGAVLLPLAYHTYFVGAPGNATPGMRVMGVRVMAWTGNEVSYPQALVQTLLFYATVAFTNGLILLVSFCNDRGRCLHDLLCGTVVVNVTDRPVLVDGRA